MRLTRVRILEEILDKRRGFSLEDDIIGTSNVIHTREIKIVVSLLVSHQFTAY